MWEKTPLLACDVMAGGLAHAFVALTTEPEDVDPQLFLHLPGHGVDVVADQAHRAGGEDADGLGLEGVISFLNRLAQLFFAAEDDLLVLHVRGKAVVHKVMVFRPLGRVWLRRVSQL